MKTSAEIVGRPAVNPDEIGPGLQDAPEPDLWERMTGRIVYIPAVKTD